MCQKNKPKPKPKPTSNRWVNKGMHIYILEFEDKEIIFFWHFVYVIFCF